jgi:hypothetical protein
METPPTMNSATGRLWAPSCLPKADVTRKRDACFAITRPEFGSMT